MYLSPQRYIVCRHRIAQNIISPKVGITGHNSICLPINRRRQYRVILRVSTTRWNCLQFYHDATLSQLV
jgi:hypothetical protein